MSTTNVIENNCPQINNCEDTTIRMELQLIVWLCHLIKLVLIKQFSHIIPSHLIIVNINI